MQGAALPAVQGPILLSTTAATPALPWVIKIAIDFI